MEENQNKPINWNDNPRNPNYAENIRPHQWKKGQSGNPGGRPKKIPEITRLLADVLGEENKEGISIAEQILKAVRNKALEGDIRAFEVLFDRAYGKAKTNIEFNQEGITIKVIRDNGDSNQIAESSQRSEEGTN
jgi:hypothetical protein